MVMGLGLANGVLMCMLVPCINKTLDHDADFARESIDEDGNWESVGTPSWAAHSVGEQLGEEIEMPAM